MDRPNLLLLHGALGTSAQFALLVPLLDERYTIHLLDFEGHGAAPMRARSFRIEHFVENILDHMASASLERVHIFGYSMGGYVACQLAATHPERVISIATLGTKFHWDPETSIRETGFLDPDKIRAKVPHFASALEARHATSGWENGTARHSRPAYIIGRGGRAARAQPWAGTVPGPRHGGRPRPHGRRT